MKKETTQTPEVKKAEKKEVTMFEFLSIVRDANLTIPRNGTGYIDGRAYKYPLLEDINNALTPLLSKHGFVITHQITNTGFLESSIANGRPNEFINSFIKLPENVSPQTLGAAITYYKRYNIVSMLNLDIEPDLDGGTGEDKDVVAPEKTKELPIEMPNADTVIKTPEQTESPAFVKAFSVIQSCKNLEALGMIRSQIIASEKFNDKQKELLMIECSVLEQNLLKNE